MRPNYTHKSPTTHNKELWVSSESQCYLLGSQISPQYQSRRNHTKSLPSSTPPATPLIIVKMAIERVPTEVLSLIMGCLLLPGKCQPWASYAEFGLEDLRNARLACRRWNEAGSPHLFRRVALLHPHDGEDFSKFTQMVANPTVRDAARCVDIYSAPPSLRLRHDGRRKSQLRTLGSLA